MRTFPSELLLTTLIACSTSLASVQVLPVFLPDAQNSSLTAINNNGFVIGVGGNTNTRPFQWTLAGGLVELPAAPHPLSFVDINESGVASAQLTVSTSPNTLQGNRWTAAGGFSELPRFPQFDTTRVRAINESGDIVSTNANFANTASAAVLYRSSGERVDLGTLGGQLSAAFGINDSGVIVGMSTDAGGVRRAFRKLPGDSLEALPSLAANGTASASVITNSGMILGSAPALTSRELQIWRTDGSTQLIPRPSGFSDLQLLAGNNLGAAVGLLSTPTNAFSAMYYDDQVGMIDLNELLSSVDIDKWHLTVAADINDNGWIVGAGTYDADGTAGPNAPISAGFVLILPEPVWIKAFVCLGFLAHRRSSRMRLI